MQQTDKWEVYHCIRGFKSNKKVYNDYTMKAFKLASHLLCKPIAYVINQNIINGTCLKNSILFEEIKNNTNL